MPLLLVATSASICGDSIGYWIGRRVGPPCLTWLKTQKKLRFLSPQTFTRGEEFFRSKAGFAVFASRCLVPSLGGIINILAGAERYPYRKFLLLDACGETIGALIPLVLGFAFGASWEDIGSLLSQISTLIVILFIAIYLTILLIRTIRKWRRHQAQQDATTPTLLNEQAVATPKEEKGRKPHNQYQHRRRGIKKITRNSKSRLFPATLRRLQTYRSTDGLHTGYGFPTETTSNPGRRD
jgi:Uncharacterized membrane-associated protein